MPKAKPTSSEDIHKRSVERDGVDITKRPTMPFGRSYNTHRDWVDIRTGLRTEKPSWMPDDDEDIYY